MGFSITLPLTSTEVGQTPSIFQANWNAINDFMGKEHGYLANTTSGAHAAGIAGVMMEGTTAAISAISTTPGSGSLAFDTTKGAWVVCRTGVDTDWKVIHTNYYYPTSQIAASKVSSTTPASGETTLLPFTFTDVIDFYNTNSLGEYASNVFSAKDAGYFFVTGRVLYKTSTTNGGDTVTLTLSGSYNSSYRTISRTTVSSAYETIGISTIAYVPSGGTLAFYFTAPSGKTTTLSTGRLRIHRVS